MRAGSLREFLAFLELRTSQGSSGAISESWVEVYKCRAYVKKSAPVYDKDGVDAKELYQGTSRYFIVRNCNKINEKQRIRWNDSLYDILLVQPNYDDNSITIQVRQLNE